MDSLDLTGKYRGGKKRIDLKIDVKLSLIQFVEDGIYQVYSPALDLTGYGKTPDEAMASFKETSNEFLHYTTKKGTIYGELKKLGWNIKNKKKVSSPSLIDLLNKNKYLADIFEDKQYTKIDQSVDIPVLV